MLALRGTGWPALPLPPRPVPRMGRLKPLALSALEPVVAPPPLPLLSEVSRLFSSDVIGRWKTGSGAMTTSGSWKSCPVSEQFGHKVSDLAKHDSFPEMNYFYLVREMPKGGNSIKKCLASKNHHLVLNYHRLLLTKANCTYCIKRYSLLFVDFSYIGCLSGIKIPNTLRHLLFKVAGSQYDMPDFRNSSELHSLKIPLVLMSNFSS